MAKNTQTLDTEQDNIQAIDIQQNNTKESTVVLMGNEWKDISNNQELYNKISIANSPYFRVKERITCKIDNEEKVFSQGTVLKFEGQLPKYLFIYYRENIIEKISLEKGKEAYEEQKKVKLS
jgi:hypothetical protein